MAANIRGRFVGSCLYLVGHVHQIKLAEFPSVTTQEMILAIEEHIIELLRHCKTAPGPAGIVVTACHSIIPFFLDDKIHLSHAQTLVTTHWSKGKFDMQPDRATVERWSMKIDGKDWRVLCDEDGILRSKHPNAIVSFMRGRQRHEDKLRLGDGGIFGDCVIVNNKCGW